MDLKNKALHRERIFVQSNVREDTDNSDEENLNDNARDEDKSTRVTSDTKLKEEERLSKASAVLMEMEMLKKPGTSAAAKKPIVNKLPVASDDESQGEAEFPDMLPDTFGFNKFG
jgi:hypothetical protein